VAGNAEETRQRGRDHHQLAHILPVGLADKIEQQRQAEVRNERKRVRRVQRLRGEDREDLGEEMFLQPCLHIGAQRLGIDHLDAAFLEVAVQDMPHPLLLAHQLVRFHRDRRELLRRGQAIGGAQVHIVELLPLEARHADHEELVQIVAADREEAQPFQQRMRRIARFLQHAPVERQPAQFAVEIALLAARKGDDRIGLRHGLAMLPFIRVAPPRSGNLQSSSSIGKR
jgi:hypothetical protein